MFKLCGGSAKITLPNARIIAQGDDVPCPLR